MLNNNVNSHVTVTLFSLHKTKISSEDFRMIGEDDADPVRENGPAFLDTITEEEEDNPSSSSFDTNGQVTVQQHCPVAYRPSSETDLLEANYLMGTPDGMDWFVGEKNLDYGRSPYHQGNPSNLFTSFPVEIFPVQMAGVALGTTCSNDKIFQHSSLPCRTYIDRRGSKSLPSVTLQPEVHSLQRSMTSNNVFTLDNTHKLANSKAPSPTRAQLHDVAEWAVSSPGVTTITDLIGIELQNRETPSSYGMAVNCSIDTENDIENDVYEKDVLEIPNGPRKMKRSPAVEGVNIILEHTSASLNDLGSNSRNLIDNGSPMNANSISISGSFSSSALSLSRRYSESPPTLPRQIYDYGTDETLLEIFMTPAVDGMESKEENANLNGSKKRLFTSLEFNNLEMGLVWQDTCNEKQKSTDTENEFGNFNEEIDLPFIDNEESYSEAWYITASQQFSWLDRAELADFEEITLSYDDSFEHSNAEEKERNLTNHLFKFRFMKRQKQKDVPKPKKLPKFRRVLTKSGDGKNRWTSWLRQLCGCVSVNHGII